MKDFHMPTTEGELAVRRYVYQKLALLNKGDGVPRSHARKVMLADLMTNQTVAFLGQQPELDAVSANPARLAIYEVFVLGLL